MSRTIFCDGAQAYVYERENNVDVANPFNEVSQNISYHIWDSGYSAMHNYFKHGCDSSYCEEEYNYLLSEEVLDMLNENEYPD